MAVNGITVRRIMTRLRSELPEWGFCRRCLTGAGGDHGGLALAALAAAGDFACVDPDEPAAHGWMVAVRADGPGGATLVRLMAVESGWSILRTANPDRPDMEVSRANKTMMRAAAEFAGRAV